MEKPTDLIAATKVLIETYGFDDGGGPIACIEDAVRAVRQYEPEYRPSNKVAGYSLLQSMQGCP